MDRPQTQTVAHFAINADDVGTSRTFYERCFGWSFVPWGPPEFFQIATSTGAAPGPLGALQHRRNFDGVAPVTGFECTVAVDDVGPVVSAAIAAGGRLLMRPTTITGVGELVWLADPSGNVVGAMRYDAGAE